MNTMRGPIQNPNIGEAQQRSTLTTTACLAILILILATTATCQRESIPFQNSQTLQSPVRPFLSQFPKPSEPFHSGFDQFHLQSFQPSAIDASRHQPSPFIKPSSSFFPSLQSHPLPYQPEFTRRHPIPTHSRFLGQEPYVSNGRAPFTSQDRNANRFTSFETDGIFGLPQHKSRPFTVPAAGQSKDYDYEVNYSGLKTNEAPRNQFKSKSTDVPPITTHRNTGAFIKSQAFGNINNKPFEHNQQQFGDVIDNKRISITTHSEFGNLKDTGLDQVTPAAEEEYYDEEDEDLNQENYELPIEEDNLNRKPFKNDSNDEVINKFDDKNEFQAENEQQKKNNIERVELNNNYDDIIYKDTSNDKKDYEVNNIDANKTIFEKKVNLDANSIATTTPVPNTTTGFEVLTMSPVTMVENDNFKEFVDSGLIDNTEILAVLDFADHATAAPDTNSTDKNVSDKQDDEIDDKNEDYHHDESFNEQAIDDIVDENNNIKEIEESKHETDDDQVTTEISLVEEKNDKPNNVFANDEVLIHEIVSVVTTKSVINGTISILGPNSVILPLLNHNNTKNTEGWNNEESVQTSKTVSQVRIGTKLEEEVTDEVTTESVDNINSFTTNTPITELTLLPDNIQDPTPIPSTESIIDKLDQLQSELSSGFLTGAFNNISDNISVLTDVQHLSNASSTSVPETVEQSRPPTPIIRKFVPNSRTTTSAPYKPRPKQDKAKVEHKEDDELASLLPRGYKTRNYSRKSTTPPPVKPLNTETKVRNATIGRSLEQTNVNNITTHDLKESSFEQKSNASKNSPIEKILGGAKPIDISSLFPPGYKLEQATTKIDLNEILSKANITLKTVVADDNSLNNLSPNLLPPGYNAAANKTVDKPEVKPVDKPDVKSPTLKVVFPSRPGGRKSFSRMNEVNRQEVASDRNSPTTQRISVLKPFPVRSTTEFTGWPSPSTTPLSIEKILELQKTQQVMIANKALLPEGYDLANANPTTVPTTTTTTEATTTRTTTHSPGICDSTCSLGGTIRLIKGTTWVPELLDRHTEEWQTLANEVQTQLEKAYNQSSILNQWFRKVTIDGFSKGSVLVDYSVELADLPGQLSTLEIKRIFHAALSPAYDFKEKHEDDADSEDDNETNSMKLNLGKFLVDPDYTDFFVLAKVQTTTVGYAESDVLLPQWAIAVVVIGLASLCFVIIFGVTVLVNKQKNNQKKNKTIPLTEDMLNELNKNHMGGLDNYGAEDLYNVNLEDQWNQPYTKQSKRPIEHDNSASNLYDSWRSQWTRPSQLHTAELFNDSPWKGSMQGFRNGPQNIMTEAPDYDPYGHSRNHDVYLNNHHYGSSYHRKRSDYDTNF